MRDIVRDTLLILLILVILWLVTVSVRSAQSVTLAWDANPEMDIASYDVHWGTNSGAYLWKTNVGNVTTAEIRGLAEGRTYHFAISAWNHAGYESAPSDEVIMRADAPRRVTSLRILLGLECSTSPNGPWTDYWVTNYPVQFSCDTNLFFRPKQLMATPGEPK